MQDKNEILRDLKYIRTRADWLASLIRGRNKTRRRNASSRSASETSAGFKPTLSVEDAKPSLLRSGGTL